MYVFGQVIMDGPCLCGRTSLIWTLLIWSDIAYMDVANETCNLHTLTGISRVLTEISGSFRNFRVISGNSVNSRNSVIPLKFPLNFRVIPGFWKYNLFPLDFCQSEFWNSV